MNFGYELGLKEQDLEEPKIPKRPSTPPTNVHTQMLLRWQSPKVKRKIRSSLTKSRWRNRQSWDGPIILRFDFLTNPQEPQPDCIGCYCRAPKKRVCGTLELRPRNEACSITLMSASSCSWGSTEQPKPSGGKVDLHLVSQVRRLRGRLDSQILSSHFLSHH